ncbi:Alpha/Beta hydrolase fold,Peptidase S28 [Cinara cedri]|uniref:Lysosomal Pro-X carboxypeptidase n=1 Tax=Cinara cedri TaxID=506608 RepID=A0A5E4MFG0_9HEMI|nr:Alpha/Beta hydrolase fold,Peptidase S28 [Cinara cedri]
MPNNMVGFRSCCWPLLLPLLVFHVAAGYEYTVNYVTVPVDHFSFYSDELFELKYLTNDTYWDVQNGPIFFYCGNEDRIENFAENTGFMWEIAEEFKALIVFAEHRYYGESIPFGGNPGLSEMGYLTSQQALADFVDLIKYLSAEPSGKRSNPVIAFGGSYGGMLAAWFRMKYPAVVQGAVASSAPIWQFTGMTPCNDFYKVVTSVFRQAGAECALTISKSWEVIDNVTSTGSGSDWLYKNWELCKTLEDDDDVQDLKSWAAEVYVALSMVNYPYEANFLAPLPANPIKEVCKSMTNHLEDNETLLKSVFDGLSVYFNYTGAARCLDISSVYPPGMDAWNYQACTEMIMPFCTKGGDDDMFEPSPWDFDAYAESCELMYGVRPTTDLMEKVYGGKHIRAASNIIFSNGMLDPWSSGGVLKSVSSTVRAFLIPDAAHHLDLRASNPNDPKSVIQARKHIKNWIRGWILEYRYRN